MTTSTPLRSYQKLIQPLGRIGVWEEVFLWDIKNTYLYQNLISKVMLKCYLHLLNKKPIHLCSFYRPPNTITAFITDFITEIDKSLM